MPINSVFKFEPLRLTGAYLVHPFCASDERGKFIKDFSVSTFHSNNVNFDLKEVFYTISKRGVIRGIHFQTVKQQPKLVRCIYGKIYDVIVDLRPDSKTFGEWMGFELSSENLFELLIPAGFGHGYLVEEDSIVSYKCAEIFYAEYDSGIIWNDETINVKWPLEKVVGSDIIVSQKDKMLPTFKEFFSNKK